MRKKLVYSLSVLSAMPLAANAEAVNVNLPEAQQLKNTAWSGNPTISEGTVLVAEGASISQSVGELLPGKYVVNIEKIVSTDCDLIVNFAGTTKSIKAASTTGALEFDLTAKQDVTITISSAEGKSFQVTNVTLKLNYDFDATYKTFNDALVKVTSLLNQITYPEQISLLAKAQTIQKKIDEIKDATYDVYKKYALNGDDATNAIMDEIRDLETEGKVAVNAQYVKQLNAKLSEVYDGQPEDVKKIVKSVYDGIVAEINTFDNNNVVDDSEYQALLAKIDNKNDADNKDLKDKIRTAKETAADNDSAYNDVKAYINGLKVDGGNDYTKQWPQSDKVTYGSAYDIYTDINAQLMTQFEKDRYKNILAAAQKELSLELQKITQAEKDNEAFHDAITSKENQNKLKNVVDAAVKAMKAVLGKYQITQGQLDDFDARYTKVENALKKAKNTHKVGLEVSQIKAKLDAAEAAVKAVKDAIEGANVTTDKGEIDKTMAALNIDKLETAANNAIDALKTIAAPYTAHQTAVANAAKNKADLDKNWAKVKDDAAKYTYDNDAVSNYFKTTISNIEKAISTLATDIDKAKNSGKWDKDVYSYNTDFYGSEITSAISTITGQYNTYNTQAKAAQDNYNEVVNSKKSDGSATTADGLKKLQAKLNAANDKVKDLAIYNDQSLNDPADPSKGYKYNYAKKVVDIQAKIDAVYKKISEAKKITDGNHYNVMAGIADVIVDKVTYKKVELDASIANDIKAIEDNYKTDNSTLEAELKAAMLAATADSYDKLVDDINSLDGDKVKYGNSYEAINKGRTDIKTEEKEKLYGLDKTAAKAAIDAANAEKLAKIQENIQTIRTKLDELLAVAKQAADLVKANQEAQAELIKAIYDDAPGSNAEGNLDKYFADKITNDAKVKNATALADASVKPVKEVTKEMNTDLPKAIADLKALVGTDNASGTDRKAETLAANKEKHLQTIADLKARIDAAKKKAEDCTANYNKYQEFVTETTGKIAKAQTALTEAVGKANTADAANADYADKKFVSNQQDKLNKEKTGAKDLAGQYYKNGTMVQMANALDSQIKEVTDFAAGLEATAKANKKAYDALEKEWAAVKTLWTTVSTDIAKYDESSAREGFQQELKAELDKLNQNKTDYKKNYGDIALPNNDRVTEQATIKAKINDIKTRSLGESNYSARIKADNDRMLEVIKATVASAAKEYDLDTDTLKMFKNPTSEVLKESLGTVKTQYDALNNTLYKYAKIGSATTESTFVEVVNDKYKKAAADYAATVSPDVFDKDSVYTNDIRADIAKLVTQRENFMKAIRKAIADETKTTISGYATQINDVITQLNNLTKYNKKGINAKNAVKALSEKLAAAKDAVAAGLIPEIDAAFADLQTLKADLAKAKYDAMSAQLDADIIAAEAYAKNGQAYLADDADNLAKFNVEVKNGVTKARNDFKKNNTQAKLTDDQYNNIQALIANFVAGGKNTYETIMANNGAWPKIQGYVETAQNELQTAIDGIQKYAAAGAVQQYLYDKYQTDINKQYNDYLAKYNAGTLTGNDANDAETYLTKSIKDGGKIKEQILNVVVATNNTSVLYQEEYKVIKTNLSELEAEYNKFAASDLTDISKSEKVKTQIENIKKALGTDNGTSYKTANTAAKLLVQQKAIAELMQQLLNANYGEGVSDAATKAELEGDLAKVKSTFDKSKYTEEELAYDANVDLNSQIAQLEATIAAIEEEIAAGENLSYNKENIANKIAVAQKQATAIETQAKKNKENLDKEKANTAAAYKDETTIDDNLLKAIEATKAELDKNAYDEAKAAAFENMLMSLTKDVNDMKADFAAAQEAGIKQKEKAFTNLQKANGTLVQSTAESLYDIANTAADRQLKAEVADLQAQLDAISYITEDYTLAVQKSLASQKKAIDEAINGVKDEKGKVTANGLVQVIQNAKMQDYKLVITGTSIKSIKDVKAVDPSDDADVTTSYVYLTTNGKANKKGAIAAVQELIDQLKSDIDSKKITPEEPEPEVIPGDITGTGEVGDDDFDKFVEDLSAGNVPEPGDANFAVYDANGDGAINIADLQAIFNLSMGLNPDGSDPDAAGVRARAYGIFDAGNMAVEATKLSNGNTMLAVKLSSTTDYLAFQMDVVMGDGMSVVSENANLQLLRSNDLSNIHRIVGYGLLENNGTMLTLEVAGEGNVQFTNIVLATEKAEAVKFNLGGTTGISTIAVEKNDGNFIYDLSGKLMNGIKKGINIIRGKNGETKKVVK
jgi:DNA repair exonuclease SbcCD ATPase subunit